MDCREADKGVGEHFGSGEGPAAGGEQFPRHKVCRNSHANSRQPPSLPLALCLFTGWGLGGDVKVNIKSTKKYRRSLNGQRFTDGVLALPLHSVNSLNSKIS